MPRTSEQITQDAQQLKRLIPQYADSPQVFSSAKHAEKHGDKKALLKDRRIGAHLLRLEKLLSHDGVEPRVWDSAIKELIIEPENIPESFWRHQIQILRDNGYGEINHIDYTTKLEITEELRDAQETSLSSWREYLEQTGDQYPLWFKLYAWEGMSGLGVFDRERQRFHKRSKDTVAPYPQLNPAVLAGIYDVVMDGNKIETFNALYSRILIEQKVSIPTPENADDVHGEWREYTNADIDAITEASQATPWCIAGRHHAQAYTSGGGKFYLFHLQDQETGAYSPTACASIRLDSHGNVAELSGLKGGRNQFLEDGLVQVVNEKLQTLQGGERYSRAIEDKQKLIIMDKKFQTGEPFTTEELQFLYEVDRPIEYVDTYASDPRPSEFKRDQRQHVEQLTKVYGSKGNAELIMHPIRDEGRYLGQRINEFFEAGGDGTFLIEHMDPETLMWSLDILAHYNVFVDDVDERIVKHLDARTILNGFLILIGNGSAITINDVAERFTDVEKVYHFNDLRREGWEVTPDELANMFDDKGRMRQATPLKRIGATFDVTELAIKVYGTEPDIITNGSLVIRLLRDKVSPSLVLKYMKLNQYFSTNEMYDGLGGHELPSIVAAVPKSGIDQAAFIDQMRQKLADNKKAYLGAGSVNYDYLQAGFDVNVVASKSHIDDRNMEKYMKAGVDKSVLLDAMVKKTGDYPDTYIITECIEKLFEYGCDIDDIASHIMPNYQFDSFDKLQSYGANLDIHEVVANMRPRDVISRIRRINKRGIDVDINDILRRAEDWAVYEFMVEGVLAAGADPALVAAKISVHKYVDDVYYRHYNRDIKFETDKLKQFPEVYAVFKERIDEGVRQKTAEQEESRRARDNTE